MRPDVFDLREFYHGPLGRVARNLVRREIRRLLGYVHQHDEFYAHLTVRETLQVDHASCEVPRLEWSLH